jgi:YVTN family beta-propeller protein
VKPLATLFLCLGLVGSAFAQNGYITNAGSNNVSVIDTAKNTVTATIPVGTFPWGVAVSPDGSKVYVSNLQATAIPSTVSVIDTATNKVIAAIPVGIYPEGMAVTPDGSKVYVAQNTRPGTVSVIDTATNTVTAAIPVGSAPIGVAVSPDGSKVYVTNADSDSVSVIATATNTVTAVIPVGAGFNPNSVAATPDGSKIYVTNPTPQNVSVIATATNLVIATISVGAYPNSVAVSPDGTKVYVANAGSNNVSVIATVTDTVIDTVNVGKVPQGIAVSPDGSKVYVANDGSDTVTVIDTATNTVTAAIPVGQFPVAFGLFIQTASLQVIPSTNIVASGQQGGPFSPSSFHYDLHATYGTLNYSIITPSWLTASAEAGTVTKSAKTITFMVNSSARDLQPNSYINSINFYNTTNGLGNTTRIATLNINPKQFKITVDASPKADGTVSGGGTFSQNSSQTVTASPNAGHTFVHWTDDGKVVSTSESYTFTVAGNATLVADFR